MDRALMYRAVSTLLIPAAITGFLLGPAMELQAQVAWDAPMLMAPQQPGGFGVYLVDPYPGDGIGALLTWRSPMTPSSLGFRLGLAEGRGGDLAGYGGVDISGSLHRANHSIPLDVLWVSGVGVGVGEHALLSAPLGLTLGRVLVGDGVRFTPYVTPRLVLDAYLGDSSPRSGMDLDFVADLGADISFTSAWTIRFAATLGGREALAIGFATRGTGG